MACRNPDRAGEALSRVRSEVPGASAELVPLDLASLDSVRDAAADVAGRTGSLDVLIDNAGVMAIPRAQTADGFEMQLGTNHLGHFALTGLLLPVLLAAAQPRVVVVSSDAHRIGRIRFEDLMAEKSYGRWSALRPEQAGQPALHARARPRAKRAAHRRRPHIPATPRPTCRATTATRSSTCS